MTTLAHRSAMRGPSNGGVAARRALIRWAWRMFRREWRQQILVVALLTVAVAAAIGSITVVYNTGPAYDAEFGSANGLLKFDGSDPRELEAGLASAEESFGTIDVIGHRGAPCPAASRRWTSARRTRDGPYGGDLLALRRGSYPAGPGQVAVTDGVAELLRAGARERRSISTGVAEPSSASSRTHAISVTSSLSSRLRPPGRRTTSPSWSTRATGASRLRRLLAGAAFVRASRMASRGTSGRRPLAMFSVATVFLLLASLIAAAGFAVIAQRRLRQLGMLAAIGATKSISASCC